MNQATPQGALDPDVKIGEVVVKENPRQIAIDAMSERVESERRREIDEAVAADPGLAANQHQIEREIAAANAEAVADGLLPPPVLEDGTASVEPMHPDDPAPLVDPLPAAITADPLSEFVVMDGNKPMFKAKVNGEDKLIPLDQARRQIQIGIAAEIRMQQAAALEKRSTDDAIKRDRDLKTREEALLQRTAAVTPLPETLSQDDFSEADLLDEAREVFSTAFSGTEEDAAKKLTKMFLKLRVPAAVQPVQRVDENAIVRKAASAAVTAVQKVDKQKDVDTGYVQFKIDYPEIMSDPNLYKMADDMTDEIEKENPTWPISQVMDEAGKRTRAWVNQIRGDEPAEPAPTPAIPNIPVQAQHPTQDRQERKAQLVPMPKAAVSAVYQAPVDEPEKEQTPQEAFAELKESRGQPT